MATARKNGLFRGSLPATAGLPVLVTWVAIRPHALLAALALEAIGVLAVAASAVLSELPRLYWISAYIRLVRKGVLLATSVAEVRDLIASLGDTSEVPTGPRPPDLEERG
jgi:hypothetical protein